LSYKTQSSGIRINKEKIQEMVSHYIQIRMLMLQYCWLDKQIKTNISTQKKKKKTFHRQEKSPQQRICQYILKKKLTLTKDQHRLET